MIGNAIREEVVHLRQAKSDLHEGPTRPSLTISSTTAIRVIGTSVPLVIVAVVPIIWGIGRFGRCRNGLLESQEELMCLSEGVGYSSRPLLKSLDSSTLSWSKRWLSEFFKKRMAL